MTLVIMAAGIGSRFNGLKQLQSVGPNGEFIMDYSIYDAIKAGYTKVIFVINKDNYQIFKDTIGKRISKYIDVDYIFQTNDINIPKERIKPLGTAQAILCCKDIINENFTIINADDLYGRDAFIKSKESILNDNNFSLIGYNLIDTITNNGAVKRGILDIKNDKLINLYESIVSFDNVLTAKRLDNNDDIKVNYNTIVSMNMFSFTPKIFEYLNYGYRNFLNNNDLLKDEYLIPDVINYYLNKNTFNVNVIKTNSKWYGITYKDDLNIVKDEINKLINDGIYPYNLWN